MNEFWKQYLIVCLIVTAGAIFTHVRTNHPPNWEGFIMWLPLTWISVLFLACIFGFIINKGDEN